MKNFFIGIDAGGTKTEIIIADEQGKTVSSMVSGPANLNNYSDKHCLIVITDLITAALKKRPITNFNIQVCCVGAAGLDSLDRYNQFYPKLKKALQRFKIKKIILVNDTVIALASGTMQQPAICLIAGTGANCLGINKEGKEFWVGGLDYLLSDQGAGYIIGRQALRAVIKSFDGRGSKTIMEKYLLQSLKVKTIRQAADLIYQSHNNKAAIADFARLVFKAVKVKDKIALSILRKAVDDQISYIDAVYKKMKLKQTKVDLVLVGSVISKNQLIKKSFTKIINSRYPEIRLIWPQEHPVAGAIKICLNNTKINLPLPRPRQALKD